MAVSASKYQTGQTGTLPTTPPVNGDLYPVVGNLYYCKTDQYYYRLQAAQQQGGTATFTVVGVATQLAFVSQANL